MIYRKEEDVPIPIKVNPLSIKPAYGFKVDTIVAAGAGAINYVDIQDNKGWHRIYPAQSPPYAVAPNVNIDLLVNFTITPDLSGTWSFAVTYVNTNNVLQSAYVKAYKLNQRSGISQWVGSVQYQLGNMPASDVSLRVKVFYIPQNTNTPPSESLW